MKKYAFITCFLLFSWSADAQVALKDFDDASIYFKGIFDFDSSLDEYGNVSLDMGSRSAGRLAFRITDVTITMQERDEEPGCCDICPLRVIITFTCRKTECMVDPVMMDQAFQSGSIQIFDLKRGRKAYEYLVSLKEFIRKNN